MKRIDKNLAALTDHELIAFLEATADGSRGCFDDGRIEDTFYVWADFADEISRRVSNTWDKK